MAEQQDAPVADPRSRRTKSGAKERARQQIADENPEVEPEDIDSIERTDDGAYRAVFTDEFRTERARKKAAAEDPLRDPEDFVATTEDGSVDIRRRQAPLFEDFREDLGGDQPDESPVFRKLQRASKGYQSAVQEYAELEQRQDPTPATTVGVGGREVNLDEVDRGATLGGFSVLNVPGAALDARTVAGQGADYVQAFNEDDIAPGVVEAEQRPETSEDGDVSRGLGENQREERRKNIEAVKAQKETVEEAYSENPDVTTGAIAAAIGVGTLLPSSGIAATRATRRGLDRVRTLGGRPVPETDVTQGRTARYYDPDVPDEPRDARFPGATDRQKIQDRPAEAIREQSERNDPDVIRERFDEAGVGETSETADLYKAVETEPESSRRGAGGFRSPDVEARDAAETYELESGTFFGPDLSPAFFRTNFGDPEVRMRPGIPKLGDRPTAFAARGRVQEPEAEDLRGLERELQEADEPVLRTKPAEEVNPAEAEVLLPEGTELVDVGNRGLVESAARRVGIGSDFYLEIGNRRIPLRPVADPELTDAGESRFRRLLDDDRGQAGAGSGGGGDLIGPRRYRVGGRRGPPSGGIDRPVPVVGSPADSPAGTDVGSVSDLAVSESLGEEPGFESLSWLSEASDGGGSSAGGSPVGSSSSYSGGGGSSTSYGGGGGSSSSSGGGGESSTSYGGGGSSTSPPGPPTNPPPPPPPPTNPPLPPPPPTTPPPTPPSTPPGVPRRCPDRHTGDEDDQRVDDLALGEDEWPNPVAAPDELDDVADDVLGRNDPERRNPTDDLLEDLPGSDDNNRDSLGGFLP